MGQASEGSVAVQVVDGVTIVVLRGEHDLAAVPMLQEALSTACPAGPTIVDLTDAAFIDSSILGVLAEYRGPYDTVVEWSRLGVVMPCEGPVLAVLRLVDFGQILPMFLTVSDAMASVAAGARRPSEWSR